MAVQQNRKTRSKRGMRRGHDALKAAPIREDEDGELHRPHHVNLKTGMYRGRQVFAEKDED